MDAQAKVFTIFYTLVVVVVMFLLRKKYPNRYTIGIFLCLLAPSWGQIYVKSKYNVLLFCLMMILERTFFNFEGYTPYLLISAFSAFVVSVRILNIKEPTQKAISIQPLQGQDHKGVDEATGQNKWTSMN